MNTCQKWKSRLSGIACAGDGSSGWAKSSSSTADAFSENTEKLTPPSTTRAPTGCARPGSTTVAGFTNDRADEQENNGYREQPPGSDSVVRQYPCARESDRQAGGDAPVVADDEVPPEAAEA